MTETDGYAHLRELMDVRYAGYDRAIELLQANANSQPSPGVLEERLLALDRLTENRFRELEIRNTAVSMGNQKSIDLALQAAKEAAAKSESAASKQTDSIGERVALGLSALDDKINSIERRITTIEASGTGSKQSYGWLLALASFAVSAIVAAVVVASKLSP